MSHVGGDGNRPIDSTAVPTPRICRKVSHVFLMFGILQPISQGVVRDVIVPFNICKYMMNNGLRG